MINQHYFKNKKVTVVGLGRSGFACARLLHNLGARVSVTEKEDNEQVSAYAQQLPSAVKRELGRHTQEFIRGQDLVVVSPGVVNRSEPVVWANQSGTRVIGEIECAWMLCAGTVIAITGTNGKTTAATLIGKVLESAGKRVFILGNIGTPFCAYVDEIQSGDFVSLEVSSFQLETIKSFKPKISVILNFKPDHLDRYAGLGEYFSAKTRIFMNQDETDYLVLNYDDALVKGLAKEASARVVYFDGRMHSNPDFAAATAVASVLGIGADLCKEVFRSFSGLPHRLERVLTFQDREFINDSKATNLDATAFALLNTKKPVILIAGGRDKGIDYADIRDLVCKRVKCLVLIGESKDKIKQVYQTGLPVREAPGLEEAVKIAFRESLPGDCILFSPMCSSFDMFRNYEHRGEVFKEAVKKLAEGHATA